MDKEKNDIKQDKFTEDLNNLYGNILKKEAKDKQDTMSFIDECKNYFTDKKSKEKTEKQIPAPSKENNRTL